MGKFNLTENEIELLKYAYTDDDRIEEGILFDYQEEALHMIRKSSVYLQVRYPRFLLKMVSFLPKTKKRAYTEIQFQCFGSDILYTLRCRNDDGEDVFSDNFYDVPFEAEYDKKVEKLLKNKGIIARVYTIFPFLLEGKVESAMELFNKTSLSRNTEVFINVNAFPSEEDVNSIAAKIEDVFRANKLKGNGMIYFILDDWDINRDIFYFDEYVKERKNQKNLVTAAFRVL